MHRHCSEKFLSSFVPAAGLSDPYVKFKVGGRLLHKSRTIHRDLNPVWDEVFIVPIEDPFQPIIVKTNFKGKVINLLPDWDSALKINVTVSSGMSIPIVRNRDYGVIEFALKYNLSLRVLNASYKLTVATSVVPDIQFQSQVHTNMDNLKNWNPYDISSLMVAVPYGKELRIKEVFKQLDVHSWLGYIFIVYENISDNDSRLPFFSRTSSNTTISTTTITTHFKFTCVNSRLPGKCLGKALPSCLNDIVTCGWLGAPSPAASAPNSSSSCSS
ncbi:GD20921 [Drosophila simulans]|uniref:GD20921 n=1 Tax=Drosophila simulans TaxID=7240 RepID=B4QZD8_DROSI|nr:GD20921 [Drosophila simulans]